MSRRCAGLALLGLVPALLAGGVAAEPAWTEAAASLGIHFRHAAWVAEDPLPFEHGAGVCVADFDGDGYDDLYFVNGQFNDSERQQRYRPTAKLFANGASGLRDATAGSGAAFDGRGQGCSAADYDGDGDEDLFVTGWGWNDLYRNDGPFRFTNVTVAAGLGVTDLCAPYPCWSTGSAWADVTGDGCLDLYVAKYGNWTFGDPTEGPSLPGQANLFYRNRCDGTFAEEALERNLDDDPGIEHSRSFMPMWLDHDGDGDLDVYVASDETPNSLLRNNGDGTFTDVAREAGVDDDRASMGLEAEDLSGDGWPDLYMTHFAGQHNGLYVNNQDGTFYERSAEAPFTNADRYVGWGTGFFDADNDGDLDVYLVNGHTTPGDFEDQRRFVFRNNGDFEFDDVSNVWGPGFASDLSNARGSALLDLEHDGDLDLAINNVNNETASFLLATGVKGGFLKVQLEAPGPNRRAIGALVRVTPEGLPSTTLTARAGASFLSQNSAYLHFGLGDAPFADVEVRWPDGTVEERRGIARDQVVRVRRGEPGVVNDTLAPVSTALVGGAPRNGWHNEPVTVSLTAHDRGVTHPWGVIRLEHRVNHGPVETYIGPLFLGEGRHRLEHRAIDGAGNVEPWRAVDLAVDLSPPTARPVPEGRQGGPWFVEPATVRVEAGDALSGVETVAVAIDAGAWRAYEGPFTIESEGRHSVAARAEDVAGNPSLPMEIPILVDFSPPTVALAIEGPRLAEGRRTVVTSESSLVPVARDAGSGVAAVEHAWSGDADWLPYGEPLRLQGPDGDALLRVRARDALGHESAEVSAWLRLDNSRPPPLRVVQPPERALVAGGVVLPVPPVLAGAFADLAAALAGDARLAVVAGTVSVEARAGPDVSGVAWVSLAIDGAPRATAEGERLVHAWDTTLERPGLHVLEFSAADGRGNVATEARRVYVVPGAPADGGGAG